MQLPITREEALELLKSMPQEDSDMNHYLETEAIMRDLAKRFNEDEDYWSMVGLLHDVDWSLTKKNWAEHCVRAEEMLREREFDDQFIETVQSHAYGYEEIPKFLDKKRKTKIEHSLIAAETITGLIYAYALMRDKKISDMKPSKLKKKFKDKSFAANCRRELIKEIEETSLSLDEFFELSINAIKKIKNKIGLK